MLAKGPTDYRARKVIWYEYVQGVRARLIADQGLGLYVSSLLEDSFSFSSENLKSAS